MRVAEAATVLALVAVAVDDVLFAERFRIAFFCFYFFFLFRQIPPSVLHLNLVGALQAANGGEGVAAAALELRLHLRDDASLLPPVKCFWKAGE